MRLTFRVQNLGIRVYMIFEKRNYINHPIPCTFFNLFLIKNMWQRLVSKKLFDSSSIFKLHWSKIELIWILCLIVNWDVLINRFMSFQTDFRLIQISLNRLKIVLIFWFSNNWVFFFSVQNYGKTKYIFIFLCCS